MTISRLFKRFECLSLAKIYMKRASKLIWVILTIYFYKASLIMTRVE